VTESSHGYRSLPHTADLRIHAWAPSQPQCLRTAVLGVRDSIADVTHAPVVRTVDRMLHATDNADALARALDELIYILDVAGLLPLDLTVTAVPEGYWLRMPMGALADVELWVTPKAVALQDLHFAYDGAKWNAAVTIDV